MATQPEAEQIPPNRRGNAGSYRDCMANPLAAISHRIRVDPLGETTAEWSDVVNAGAFQDLAGYAKLARTKRAFAVGGLQLLIECGLVVDWYRNDASRKEALGLIDARGARPLLNALTDKDGADSIFGKNDLRDFFQYFPEVDRPNDNHRPKQPVGARSVRRDFPLRLRKAIEFLFLTEAVLRYRFSIGETIQRFQQITGHTVTSPDDAAFIWEYMWLEPLLYVVEPDPRHADVSRIIAQQDLQAIKFFAACDNHPSVLQSVLRGVPARYDTARAAALACDNFYGPDAAPTNVVSIAPEDFDKRLDRLQSDVLLKEGGSAVETIIALTPFR